MRNVRNVFLASVILLVLAACSSDATPVASGNTTTNAQAQSETAQQNVQGIAQPAQAANDAENANLVASVNGTDITRAEFEAALANSPLAANAASRAALEQDVLYQLILQELIFQSANELGVTVTDADVQQEIDLMKAEATSDEAWQAWLAQNGFENEQAMLELQREALITQRVRDTLLSDYLGDIEQVNARHIVVPTLQEAEDIIARLQAGESFADLSAQYSLDSTTRNRGGNLGWFARNELFYPRLEDVAFQLEPGASAGPIETSLGFHIIQTLEKDVRPVEPERLPMLANNIFTTWLDERYNNATIEQYIEW